MIFRKREKHQFVVPLTYAFIVWFLYLPWLGTELRTLVYWDSAITNRVEKQNCSHLFLFYFYFCFSSLTKDMFIDFRGGGMDSERERENELHPICTPTGDLTCNLSMCSDWQSNPQPSGVWDDAPTSWAI